MVCFKTAAEHGSGRSAEWDVVNADREFNKMDCFVVRSLRSRRYRRRGQRPTKRTPFTSDQLHGMGLHKLMAP